MARARDRAKAKAGNADLTEHGLPGGGKAFQYQVPATNIPGSYAVYERQVDASGKVISWTKTTYGPNGEIVDVHTSDPSTGIQQKYLPE
jgi:hypothetical protein